MQNLKYEVQILYPSFPYYPPSSFMRITPSHPPPPSTTLLLSFIVSSSSLYYRPRNPPSSYTNCIQLDRDGRQTDRHIASQTHRRLDRQTDRCAHLEEWFQQSFHPQWPPPLAGGGVCHHYSAWTVSPSQEDHRRGAQETTGGGKEGWEGRKKEGWEGEREKRG